MNKRRLVIILIVLIGIFQIGKLLYSFNLFSSITNASEENVNYLKYVKLDEDSMLISEFYKDDLIALYEYKVDGYQTLSYAYPTYIDGELIPGGSGSVRLENSEGYVGFAKKSNGELIILNLNIEKEEVKDPLTGAITTNVNKTSSSIKTSLYHVNEYSKEASLRSSVIFQDKVEIVDDQEINLFILCMTKESSMGSCNLDNVEESSNNYGLAFSINVSFSTKDMNEVLKEKEK